MPQNKFDFTTHGKRRKFPFMNSAHCLKPHTWGGHLLKNRSSRFTIFKIILHDGFAIEKTQ